MAGQNDVAPIIIKRKKVVAGGGHHGGAWKVAYADFVTAMMAFFLLMWLLNATTEKQRKGIADYFSPTIPINRVSGGGDGNFGGQTLFSEDELPKNGTGATNARPTESRQARGESGLSEDGAEQEFARDEQDREFKELEEALMGRGGESTVLDNIREHIVTRVTDEGLLIEIFDLEDAPLFVNQTSAPTPLLTELARVLAEVGQLVRNPVAIEGHTRSNAIVMAENPVWDLSSQRANRMRLLLEGNDFETTRIDRITGHADREPAVRNPMSVRNNRLEVIFLRSDM